MKKWTLVVGASCIFVAPLALAANSSILNANNEVGVYANGQLFNYQENITPGPSDTESGWTPGFGLKGSYMGDLLGVHNAYAALHYQYNGGTIKYMGAVASGGTISPYDTVDHTNNYRLTARVGEGLSLTSRSMITPYVEGGYQHWNRSFPGVYGYAESYSAGLIGAGAKYQYAFSNRLVGQLNGSVLAVVGGGMTPTSPLDGLDFGSASFGGSAEENIGASVDYRIDGPLHLFGGLSYTHYTYSGGPLAYGAREPSSQTNMMNIYGGLAYTF